jgi:hypothetical protein
MPIESSVTNTRMIREGPSKQDLVLLRNEREGEKIVPEERSTPNLTLRVREKLIGKRKGEGGTRARHDVNVKHHNEF